ncbi:HNH endonuclease [Streptomyces afghaniensis]|uniref:HNH endonuclease n=1 Tax=Streptomyces afghaniensis TaxID=66865 RepID=UPI0027802125|nr:HNH endonuclease [Streptomyces afghaniensis]MDQ1018953.1 hypothetical protein [Streptomyces afghaniensis]
MTADLTAPLAAAPTPVCAVCGKPPEPDNRLKGDAHIRYCYDWRRRNDPNRPKCPTVDCGRPILVKSTGLCDRCYQRKQRGNDPAARPFHQRNEGSCKVEWCTNDASHLGWCKTCYDWSRSNGGADPAARRWRYARSIEDLLALIMTIEPAPETGCRVSTGVFWTNPGGYPITTIANDPRAQTVTRLVLAHTLGRPLKAAMQACHSCDNPPCVEPSHLWEGTAADNSRDRDAKGRGARGVRNGRARLDPAKVRDIRARYVPGNNQHESNIAALAAEFGIKPQAIRDVVHRRTWAHVE